MVQHKHKMPIQLLEKHSKIFIDGLGTITFPKLFVLQAVMSRFHQPHPVLYGLHLPVEREWDWLESAGLLERVDGSCCDGTKQDEQL